ncbi:MAG TPA: hypothetical protein VKB88_23790 [Bryobacteraceae bacterium]|nr:hypothetical protein [Bryobacteraceae bacterium]
MPFAKLTITTEAGKKITPSYYNPEKYSVTKGVQYAEINIPGLDEPVLQFIRGQNEKVTLDLFFDTTEKGMVTNVKDVRDLTKDIYNLLVVDASTHAPPRFKIEWGTGKSLFGQGASTSYCVMESMNEEFTLFAPTGEPLRAKLTVTIRSAPTIELQFQAKPRHSSDRTKVVTVVRGQRISDVAWQEYGDPTQWRPIADASNIDNPRFLDPGTMLKVPSLPGGGQ